MTVKLSYNSANFRIRMSFCASAAVDPAVDIDSFVKKAYAKLEQVKDEEKIEVFYVFEKQLAKYWQALKTVQESSKKELFFDLGFGAPALDMVLSAGNKTVLAYLKHFKHDASENVSYEAFLTNIHFHLKDMGVDHLAPDFSLKAAYYHYLQNDLITPYPIMASKVRSAQAADLSVTINKSLAECYLYASSSRFFQTNDGLKEVYAKAKQLFPKVKTQFPRAHFLGSELMGELKDEMHGPASVGLDLPKVFTIAINGSHKQSKKNKEISLLRNPKESPLKLKLEEDDLKAVIALAKTEVENYNTLEKLTELVKSHGIKSGYQNYIGEILQLITAKKSLQGAIVAAGKPPTAGFDVYVHRSYQDSSNFEKPKDDENVDLREIQNSGILEPGDVIAELRYKDGHSGKNVFGVEVFARVEDSKKKLRVGKNVELDDKGRAVSKIHGMPLVIDSRVDCNPVFVHNGNINLSSGNLDFEGSAEIKGNIESGAVVNVSENLVVGGTIGTSTIRCQGNLTVKGGIVCADGGRIEVGGRLTADFIENSQIIVKGDLIVNQSIVNSNVIVGGKLQIKTPRSGIIGGGNICVRDRLITGNLGFNDGRKTIVRMGVDWVSERKIRIQSERLAKVVAKHDSDQRNLDELKKQTSRRVDGDKLEQRNSLQKRLDRLGKIKRKLERKINGYQEDLTWNKDTVAIINSELSRNTEVLVAGKSIPLQESVRSVILTYHKLRNGRVNPTEYLNDFENKLLEKAKDKAS